MPAITYHQLGEFLQDLAQPDGSESSGPVYLIFGDDMLVDKAFAQLLDILIPAEQRTFGYEPMDGNTVSATDVIEAINTYGLGAGRKMVAWREAPLFRGASDSKQLLASAKSAFTSGEYRKAAGFFLRYLSGARLDFEDVGQVHREAGSLTDLSGAQDEKWIDDLVNYCRQNGLKPSIAADQADAIKGAVEKGIPGQHYLVITTATVDRRQALFKTIRDRGVVIDCSVPKGNRRADKQAQEKALRETMATILKPHRKKMDRAAFDSLCDKTGFDLRTFANNLEILIHFVGDRQQITAADVTEVLQRTKLDPIYELTNAVSDRNLDKALFFLDSLLRGEAHPLQILAALTNQMRRLLLAKDFAESPHGEVWFEECSYNQFRTQVVPAMMAYDQQLTVHLESCSGVTPDIHAAHLNNHLRK